MTTPMLKLELSKTMSQGAVGFWHFLTSFTKFDGSILTDYIQELRMPTPLLLNSSLRQLRRLKKSRNISQFKKILSLN